MSFTEIFLDGFCHLVVLAARGCQVLFRTVFSRFLLLRLAIYLSGFFLFYLFYLGLASENRPDLFFNADGLMPASLYRDVFVDRFPLSGWSFPPAVCLFPDFLFFFLAMFVTGGTVPASILYSLVLWTLFLEGIFFLIQRTGDGQIMERMICAGVLAGFIFPATSLGLDSGLLLPLFQPGFHAGAFLVSLYSAGFLLGYLKGASFWNLIALFILSCLALASDKIYWITGIAPLFTAALISTAGFSTKRKSAISVALILLSALTGTWLIWELERLNYFLIPAVGFSLKNAGEFSLSFFMQSILKTAHDLFSSSMPYAAFFSMALISLAVGGFFSTKRKEYEKAFVIIYTLIVILFNYSGLALSRALFGLYHPRYAISLFLIVPAALAICPPFFSRRSLLAASGILVSLLFVVSVYEVQRTGLAFRPYRHPLSECLDSNQKKYNLSYGLADYWHARPVSLLSRSGLRMNQITYALGTHYWLNNYYWYFGKKANPQYDFIITNGLDRALILKKFGSPAASFFCPSAEVFVYNRPGDEAFRNLFHATESEIKLWQFMLGR